MNLVVRIRCVHLYDDSGMMRYVLLMCCIVLIWFLLVGVDRVFAHPLFWVHAH